MAPLDARQVRMQIEALLPRIAERADEFEEARRIPAELAQQMKSAGILSLAVPVRFGGPEFPLPERLEIVQAVSAVDASAGWTVAIAADGVDFLRNLPATGLARIYAGGPNQVAAGGAAPTGRAVTVEGGYRVDGRWAWATGCLHADWLLGSCIVLKDGSTHAGPIPGQPRSRIMVFPASRARIHHDETWFPAGMRGTGSCDISVQDLFVPDEHSYDMFDWSPPADDRTALPNQIAGAMTLASVMVGAARGAVCDTISLAKAGRQRLFASARSAEQPVFQYRLAEAEMRVRAAKALADALAREAFEAAPALPRGIAVLLTPLTKAAAATAVYAAQLAQEAVDICCDIAGSASVPYASSLSRRRRDIQVLRQHVAIGDPLFTRFGAGLLGIEAMP